jgi:diguanylate cyclase (GGDEF)-like protein
MNQHRTGLHVAQTAGLNQVKTLPPAIAIIFACTSAGLVAARSTPPVSPALTTLHAVVALTNKQASQHQPVSFDATVTYYRSFDKNLFVQDGGSAIFVRPAVMHSLVPGDRIRVHGTMHESFRPYVDAADITLLDHGVLPEPLRPSFEQMIRAETDCKLVKVRAVIESASLVPSLQSPTSTTQLSVLVDGEQAVATINSDNPARLPDLLGAEVELAAVQAGVFDNKMQQTGILFHVQSLDQVKILKRAGVDPWSIAVTPMDRVLTGYRVRNQSERERVHGTITYYQPGVALALQDGAQSIWIGFPTVENGFLTLAHGEVHETPGRAPVSASLFTWRQLALGGNDGHSHVFDLVSVEGQVVTEVRQAKQDEYVLDSDGHLLSAIMRHPGTASPIPLNPMREVPVGTHIRVTGICMLTDANPFNGEVPFDILMRTPEDIVVLARPSLLNVRNLILLVGLLIVLVFAVVARGWIIERRVRRQTAAVAYLERRRGRILEEISGSRPLAEIIEMITEVVSFKLLGAPCWCEIRDGARLGNAPADLTRLRVSQTEIHARSGPSLGTIFTACDSLTKPCAETSEALAMGAGLAALAIETRRLYSDLLHRSGFDLLTDIENRFSMEKHLDELIDEARQAAGIFGLIYIDLDDFKQVNDKYGHQVGDLYLKEAAARMKSQLRPGDILARLGGDEFAVLVPAVRNRSGVEEIMLRLERCFDEPFFAQGYAIEGSASIGAALYPEDANSRDTLLRRADTAMYIVKKRRTARGSAQPTELNPELISLAKR